MADLAGAGWLWACLLLSRRSPLATGLLAGVAFLTRTAFVYLIVLLPAWYAWRRQWRSAAQCLATSTPMVLGWAWFTKTHTSGANDPALTYYTSYLNFQVMQGHRRKQTGPWF